MTDHAGNERATASDALHDGTVRADAPSSAFEQVWRTHFKRRVLVVVSILSVWSALIEGRLIQLQVLDHTDLLDQAERQQEHTVNLPAKRGDIVDRNGEILAYSVDADSITASPVDIKKPAETAAAVCGALDACSGAEQAQFLEKLQRGNGFAYLRRFVSADEAARVAALKIHGVGVMQESRRYYPKRDLAAHVIGYAPSDNAGRSGSGIEATRDADIKGHDGTMIVEIDAHRNGLDSRIQTPPTAGATIELTIDQYLQYIAERELKAGVEENHAKGGSAVIMDPHTGEILALANEPTFNPNEFSAYSDTERHDRAVEDLYEPGSTFKIVTASAALQEGVVRPTDLIDCSGVITIGKRKPIPDAEPHGVLSFEDVIVESSNVGAIKVGLKVGAERLLGYVRRYGFGESLAPDFRAQSHGQVAPLARINDSTLASMSMGYEVGVTPLQMAAAVSAVANGGTLFQPHVVRATIRDGVRTAVEPKALREPITAETAATLTSIMEEVTRRGTGQKAQLDGYQVAGKTGTANKLINGAYSDTDFNASFVGFVPSRDPVFVIVVVVDTPRGASHFGGDVSAPIFHRIAAAALRQYGVPATINPTLPVLVTSQDAVVAMTTPSRESTPRPTLAELGGLSVVPDVRGMGAREALHVLGAAGLSMQVDGSGVVVTQTPEAGSALERGGWGVLHLQRDPPTTTHTGGGGGK